MARAVVTPAAAMPSPPKVRPAMNSPFIPGLDVPVAGTPVDEVASQGTGGLRRLARSRVSLSQIEQHGEMGAELIRLIELHDGLGVPTGLGEGKSAVEVLARHCPRIDLSAGGTGKHPSSERT